MFPYFQNLSATEGTLIEAGGNRPLLLNLSDAVWFIETGVVDVFAVPLQNGEPAGSRTHLFRTCAPQALFGLGAGSSTDMGLLAVGGAGARIRALPISRLKELAREPAAAQELASLIEEWISALYRGLSADFLPKEFAVLEAGRETHLPDGAAARPPGGVVWIKLLQGSLQLVGREELPLPRSGELIPIASSAWVQAAEPAVVSGCDTQTLLGQDSVWSGLQGFYRLVTAWAVWSVARRLGTEKARLEAKNDAGRRAMEGAVLNLSSLLQAGVGPEVAVEQESNATLAACQRIGQVMGFTFRTQADAKRGPSDKDPLLKIIAASRLRLRRVVLVEDWWRHDNGPLLGYHNESNQPVALLPTSVSNYEVVDPVQQTRGPVTAETAGSLKPMAYTFFRPFPNRALSAWDVMKFGLQGAQRDAVTVTLIGMAGGLLSVLTPIATGVIFDTIIPGAERSQLLQLTLGLMVVAFASVMFQITRSIAMLRIETKSDASIQSAVWDRLLGLPLPFFRNYTAGDLAMRANGINDIRRILSGVVVTSLITGVFSLFNFALLFYYSMKLALLSTGVVALSVAATFLVSWLHLRYQRPIYRIQGKIAGAVLQFISGIAKLRVAGAEGQAYAVWAKLFGEEKRLDLKTGKLWIAFNAFNTGYPILTSLALFAAMAFWLDQKMSTGSFLAFSAAFGGFLHAMLAMSSSLISLLDCVPIYERAKPILATLPEVDEARSDPGELTGKIELSRVNFRYKPDTPLVLRDLSFQINPGEFVAIVGPSGSGKSTLLRLLLGFEWPESGATYYDGLDLAGLDVQAVRRQCGVVLQSGKLIPGTIFENIVGSSPYPLEAAWEAAEKAGLDEDIKQMPMGMHTILSEGASTLSGGQRQRLMIARAIVSRPRILLFDEATSALDNRTQAIVSKSLEQLQATRIVIAHRLSTIMNADRIFVVQAGRLVQSGTYRELVDQPGTFSELAKRQLA